MVDFPLPGELTGVSTGVVPRHTFLCGSTVWRNKAKMAGDQPWRKLQPAVAMESEDLGQGKTQWWWAPLFFIYIYI